MVDSSFEKVKDWYETLVGEKGHYYHENVIMPKVIPLLDLTPSYRLIDFGCGQGILERSLKKKGNYLGIDASPSLIKEAKRKKRYAHHEFMVHDVTKPLDKLPSYFTHGAFILSLQNIEHPEKALALASHALIPNGRLVIVLNHPCFRIPRQTHWYEDPKQKILFRRVDRYLSKMKIPIRMHGKKKETTYSYHFSFTDLSDMLLTNGFVIEKIEEWCSDKVSKGSKAKMENRARKEIPLFCAISALLTNKK